MVTIFVFDGVTLQTGLTEINTTDPAHSGGPGGKTTPTPRTNQIAGFIEFRPLTCTEKQHYLRQKDCQTERILSS